MITKDFFLEYLNLLQDLKRKERSVYNRAQEVAFAVVEIRGNVAWSWNHAILGISSMDSTTVVVHILDKCDNDVLSSFDFPVEYLWTDDWKEIEKKRKQEEQKQFKEEQKKQEAVAREKEYTLFLKLKKKFEDK